MERTAHEWEQGVGGQPVSEDDVMAKPGGIGMPENGFNRHPREKLPTSDELMEAMKRYYEFTIDVFGVDRRMFELNFPVDIVTCSYNVLWNSFKCLVADNSAGEKAELFHDTATRGYRAKFCSDTGVAADSRQILSQPPRPPPMPTAARGARM